LFIIAAESKYEIMSQKKHYLYKLGRQSTADYFFLLGHCERLEILETLQRFGPTRFISLAENSPLSRSALTQHIHMLRSAGLIRSCSLGRASGYSLNEEAMRFALLQMEKYLCGLKQGSLSTKAA